MKDKLLSIAVDIVGAMILIVFIIFLIVHKNKENRCKAKIGTQIVLYSDTLMIIDYSLLNDNYTLSNGMKVNFELIEALPVIK